MFRVLFSWLRRRPSPAREPLLIQMYTRHGCHLCDAAWQLLLKRADRHHLRLEAIDIDADPSLRAQYGGSVPVVLVDGKVRFRGRINPVLLDRVLQADRTAR